MTKVSRDGGTAQERTWLVFALGPYVMCASALDVEGIIQRPPTIARFPLAPDYALGAFLFREQSAAAISLRKKLKLREGGDRATSPFIVARVADSLVAFCVDEVKDVIEEKDAEWRALPSMLEGALFDRLGTRDGQLILQTSFAALRDAQVDFESFAAQLRTRTPVGVAPDASDSPSDPNHRRELPGVASTSEPKPVPEGVLPKEATDESDESAPAAAASAVSAVAHRSEPTEPARAAVGRKVGLARNAALGSANLPVRAKPRAAPSLPAQALRGEQRVPPAPVSSNEIAAAPVATVGPHAEVPRVIEIEKAKGRNYMQVAMVVVIAAVAATVYALLPAPSRRAASIAAASAVPSSEHGIAPVIAAPAEATPKPIAAARPEAVVLTLPAASGMTERVHTYTVLRGDTLWQIAKRHVGDPFQYPELARLSHIRNPDLIQPGDIVRIEIRKAR